MAMNAIIRDNVNSSSTETNTSPNVYQLGASRSTRIYYGDRFDAISQIVPFPTPSTIESDSDDSPEINPDRLGHLEQHLFKILALQTESLSRNVATAMNAISGRFSSVDFAQVGRTILTVSASLSLEALRAGTYMSDIYPILELSESEEVRSAAVTLFISNLEAGQFAMSSIAKASELFGEIEPRLSLDPDPYVDGHLVLNLAVKASLEKYEDAMPMFVDWIVDQTGNSLDGFSVFPSFDGDL